MQTRKSTIWLMSLQCELSMRIGTSLDVSEMLRGFLVVLSQRLQLRTTQIWLTPVTMGAHQVYAYPAWSVKAWEITPWRQANCEGFMLSGCFEAFPLETTAEAAIHALNIEGVGALFMESRPGAMQPDAFAVVRGLMPHLARAIFACADHQNRSALLELSREQNRALEQARQLTEQTWRNKSEFLAAISHEMRTPLNSILGFADLLQLELEDGELRDYARSILSSGRHLHAMFNDLLDLARLDARRLVLHPEDIVLEPFCAELWAPVAVSLQARGLAGRMSLAADLPDRIVVDPVRLRQILGNLLGNALRYTQEGRVDFVVSVCDGLLVFSVQDSGPGIASEEHALVFERFRQLGGGGRHSEGAGLGLAISRELAENMGGFITLDSAPGKGAVFTLRLPPVDPQLTLR